MASLEYSVEAKNVLSKFYGVEKVLYVEGDEDIPFWELIFDKLAGFSVQVEEVGGKCELAKYVEQIETSDAEFLVAMDSDYDRLENESLHPSVIKTYGYSIENSLINEEILTKVLRTAGKLPRKSVSTDIAKKWLEDISNVTEQLVMRDIVGREIEVGVEVIPKNSDRFMSSRNSCCLCVQKIKSHIDTLGFEVSENVIEDFRTATNNIGVGILELLNGHFLLSAALRFIKVTISAMKSGISISKDMLFSNLLAVFSTNFNATHPHFAYYEAAVSAIEV